MVYPIPFFCKQAAEAKPEILAPMMRVFVCFMTQCILPICKRDGTFSALPDGSKKLQVSAKTGIR
jgi:hypothetical protein